MNSLSRGTLYHVIDTALDDQSICAGIDLESNVSEVSPDNVFHFSNSIVAGNSATDDGPDGDAYFFGSSNLIGLPEGLTLADILDPAGLADNGGPTKTIALVPTTANPAIDAGDPEVCAAPPVNGLDQRGLSRDRLAHVMLLHSAGAL